MKIKSRKFKFSQYFWVFFILGFSVGYPRQRGVVLLLEAKCSFREHDANSKATRRGALQAQAKVGTFPSQGSHCGDFSPAGWGFDGLPTDPWHGTGLVSRCSSGSCEKSPSPYLYRLQSFQGTPAATSLHKINGVLFMDFSYSWEPDSAWKGLLIQLPGRFYTVKSLLFSLHCLGVSFRRAVEIRPGCYHSCTEGYAGTCFIKNIFSRFIIAIKFSPLAKTRHWQFSRASEDTFWTILKETGTHPMQFTGTEVLGGRKDLGVVIEVWGHFYSVHNVAQVTLPNTGKPKRGFNCLSSIRKCYHINLIASW